MKQKLFGLDKKLNLLKRKKRMPQKTLKTNFLCFHEEKNHIQ